MSVLRIFIGHDTRQCAKDKDFRGLIWNKTAVGSTIVKLCPPGFKGIHTFYIFVPNLYHYNACTLRRVGMGWPAKSILGFVVVLTTFIFESVIYGRREIHTQRLKL